MPSQATYTEVVKSNLIEDMYASIEDSRLGEVVFLIGKHFYKNYSYGDVILFKDLEDQFAPIVGTVIGEFDNTDKLIGPVGSKAIRISFLDTELLDESLGTVYNTGRMTGGVNAFNSNLPPISGQNPESLSEDLLFNRSV